MMKMNDPLAHLRWLAHHPSLLVSGTTQGAIKAMEDQMRALEYLSSSDPPLSPPPEFRETVATAREWCAGHLLDV